MVLFLTLAHTYEHGDYILPTRMIYYLSIVSQPENLLPHSTFTSFAINSNIFTSSRN